MRIYTLIENTTRRQDLTAEHGLSLYIETGERRILMDTGQTGAFAENAEKMGVDISGVDTCILSHGHYDHGGGIRRFLAVNDHANIYMSHLAFGAYYNGEKYIGLDASLRDEPRIRFARGVMDLGDGLTLTDIPDEGLLRPVESFSLTKKTEDGVFPDEFEHEQYLLIREEGRTALFSGCSHRGVVNIASYFQPDWFIGGFHLKNLDPAGEGREMLEQIAEELLALPSVYWTGHCTGIPQYNFLKERMGDRLHYHGAGDRFDLI